MIFTNPPQAEICQTLREIRTIAVVGLSNKPDRPSFRVARAMQSYGYRIVPVHPLERKILGEPVYASLEAIPFKVDIVDVFRAPEHVPPIVEACIALKLPRIWLQEGVVNEEAAIRARKAGIAVVMDRCIWKEHAACAGKA